MHPQPDVETIDARAGQSGGKHGTASSDELWATCGGGRPPEALPPQGVRVRTATLAIGDSFEDIWLAESPEPLPWQRLRLRAAMQHATIPLRGVRSTIGSDFNLPDAGFEFERDDIRWRAQLTYPLTLSTKP